ncbi:MAG: M24 family metallopeptidase [Armatimonadota bacterium]
MPDSAKLTRFADTLKRSEFDVVVAASPENTWYLSEVIIDTQRSLLERLALVVWGRSGDPVYIVCTNEEVQARRDSWIRDIRGYVEYQQSPMQLLADVVIELGAAHGAVGIEKHFLNVHYYEELTRLLPAVTFTEVGPFFDRIRTIKTPNEIRLLEEAAMVTDRAIRKAFEAARPGMTERHVGAMLTSELILGGAEMPAFQVLAAGANTCSTHHRPGDYVIRSGDVMRTDFGGVFPQGYFSDLARTIVVGGASQRQHDVYATLWEEHDRLISMMRAGVSCRELFDRHKTRWEALGWRMVRPHIGHSLGIGLHEYPLIMPSEEAVLQPSMCMSIEPNHLIPATEKYHVEDLVVIEDNGPRVLSRSADWSPLLTPGG